MNSRNGKKLLILAASCAGIILGLYMTFLKSDAPKKNIENTGIEKLDSEQEDKYEMKESNPYNYSGKDLPTVENETAEETYNNGKKDLDVYFSNSEALDQGKMPLSAQAILSAEVQTFLFHNGYVDVTELYVDDESYYEDDEKIYFVCYMDGYEEVLQIEYWFEDKTLKYFIMYNDSDKYEAGGRNG